MYHPLINMFDTYCIHMPKENELPRRHIDTDESSETSSEEIQLK